LISREGHAYQAEETYPKALKARHSKAQGVGREAAGDLGQNEEKESPARAKQVFADRFRLGVQNNFLLR